MEGVDCRGCNEGELIGFIHDGGPWVVVPASCRLDSPTSAPTAPCAFLLALRPVAALFLLLEVLMVPLLLLLLLPPSSSEVLPASEESFISSLMEGMAGSGEVAVEAAAPREEGMERDMRIRIRLLPPAAPRRAVEEESSAAASAAAAEVVGTSRGDAGASRGEAGVILGEGGGGTTCAEPVPGDCCCCCCCCCWVVLPPADVDVG